MILGTRHTGLVVRDINRSLHFYRDVLGLKVWKHAFEEGAYIDTVVGIAGTKLEWIKLKAADNTLLELIHYHTPGTEQSAVINMPSNHLGCSHVAFTVDDLEQVYTALMHNNGHCVNAPVVSPDGKVKVMYCHDPDGIILELAEEIKHG